MGLNDLNSGNSVPVHNSAATSMYCSKCGQKIIYGNNFCVTCGNRIVSNPESNKSKRQSFTLLEFFLLVVLGTVLWIALPIITLIKFLEGNKNTHYYLFATIVSFFTALMLTVTLKIMGIF